MTPQPDTTICEIAPGIHRVSTYLAEGPPGGLTYNQFLVTGAEPLLFHTGLPQLFPGVCNAVATVIDPASIRWISSGHASRPDEYGALNQWEQLAPAATAVHGRTGCFVCLAHLASRAPRALADSELIDIGGHRLQWIDTPHVPGPWEAGVLYDQTTETLFCGDLFAGTGPTPAMTSEGVVDAAIACDQLLRQNACTPHTGTTLRRLAALQPRRLALMHGPTFVGAAGAELSAFAAYFDTQINVALPR